jgi:hypothetical protein
MRNIVLIFYATITLLVLALSFLLVAAIGLRLALLALMNQLPAAAHFSQVRRPQSAQTRFR